MPITGTFAADFSAFSSAVDGAEVKLRSFEEGSNKVASSLSRMTESFSGRKVIQDAELMAEVFERAGGAAAFTDAELKRMATTGSEAVAKLTALGQDVPPGIQKIADQTQAAGFSMEGLVSTAGKLAAALGIGFSVGAVVNFGKALVDDAGALVDLSQKSGNSIEQLQRFAFVGSQANVSVDAFTQAAFKLGIALEGGDKSVVHAVEHLGLSYTALRAMSPDEQFNATVKALEAMIDPQDRNRTAVELFGKSFSEIAPAVAAGYTDMARQATVSSDAQIKAIDAASDAWERWVQKQKTTITSQLGNQILLFDAVAKLGDGYATFLIQTDKSITSIEALNAALIKAAGATDISLPGQAKSAALTKEQQDAADKLAAAMVELNSAGVGWQGTLETIDGETVDAIRYYLEAGIAQDKLATAYSLTAAQVGAVASALAAEKEALKAEQDAFAKASVAVGNLQDLMGRGQKELTTLVAASATEFLRLGASQSDVALAFNLSAGSVKFLAEELTKATAAQAAHLAIANTAVNSELQARIENQAAMGREADGQLKVTGAVEAYRIKLLELNRQKVDGFPIAEKLIKLEREFIAALDAEAAAASQVLVVGNAVSASIQSTAQSFAGLTVNIAATNAQMSAFYANLANHSNVGIPGADNIGVPSGGVGNLATAAAASVATLNRVPRFDGGGPTEEGLAYLHNREYVVPSGGALVMRGGGGGGTTTIQIYVTQPLGTPTAIAAAVDQALMARQRNTGQRMPVA